MVGLRSTGLPECGPTDSWAPEPRLFIICLKAMFFSWGVELITGIPPVRWLETRLHPPFPCMLYETTSRWQHVYASLLYYLYSLGWRDREIPAQKDATILKPLVPNPHSPPFTLGVTCWCPSCTIPTGTQSQSQHSALPSLKFSCTLPSPSPSSSSLHTRELGAFIIS